MTDVEIYRSPGYAADSVAKRYVNRSPTTPTRWRVYECAAAPPGRLSMIGAGPTLREYDTDGDDIPADLKALCDRIGQTVRWP